VVRLRRFNCRVQLLGPVNQMSTRALALGSVLLLAMSAGHEFGAPPRSQPFAGVSPFYSTRRSYSRPHQQQQQQQQPQQQSPLSQQQQQGATRANLARSEWLVADGSLSLRTPTANDATSILQLKLLP